MKKHLVTMAMLATLGHAQTVDAGERTNFIAATLVTQTPSREANACFRTLTTFTEDEQVVAHPAARVAQLAGGGIESAMQWPTATIASVRARLTSSPTQDMPDRIPVDGLMIVDCRPETQTLDVIAMPPSGKRIEVHIRNAPLDRTTLRAVVNQLRADMYDGFVP